MMATNIHIQDRSRQSSVSAGAQILDSITPVVTPERTTLSSKELLTGLANRYRKIEAIEVDYTLRARERYVDPSEQCSVVPFGHHHYAFKSTNRFQSDSDPSEPLNDPVVLRFWNETGFCSYRPLDKVAEIKSEKDRHVDFDLYLSLLTWYEGRDARRAPRNPLQPPAIWGPMRSSLIRRLFAVRVRGHLEAIDAHPCHVLEPHRGYRRERIWIDVNCGFVVRLHELDSSVAGISRSEWPLQFRTEYKDVRLAAGHIWLPWNIRQVLFTTDLNSPNARQPEIESQFSAAAINLNELVRDDLFVPQYALGTIVIDWAKRQSYRVGENGEPTDRHSTESYSPY